MLNQQRQPNSPVPEPPAEASGQMEDLALALEGGAAVPLAVAELPEVQQFRPKGSQSWRWLLITFDGLCCHQWRGHWSLCMAD